MNLDCEVKMYAIVEYTDNTMEKFYIMEISDNYIELDKTLQAMRRLRVYEKDRKMIRIIRLS